MLGLILSLRILIAGRFNSLGTSARTLKSGTRTIIASGTNARIDSTKVSRQIRGTMIDLSPRHSTALPLLVLASLLSLSRSCFLYLVAYFLHTHPHTCLTRFAFRCSHVTLGISCFALCLTLFSPAITAFLCMPSHARKQSH